MTFSALDSALTGPLFASEAMREIFSDRTRLAAMLEVEAALARAQASLGLVPDTLATAIAAIDPASLDIAAIGQATVIAGVPTIPFVKAVQARLPPDLERAFHKGATTQDILDSALVLQTRSAFGWIAGELDAILAGLSKLAETHRETPCVGRTYGQHAAPVTFGFKVAAWLTGIADVAAKLPALRDDVLTASLGGPVGTLAAFGAQGPAVLEAFARELDLKPSAMAWHAQRGRIAEAGFWLASLTGALAKMAGDVAHLASTEVGEVAEPHVPGRGGSSAMPHKRNPVSATVILSAHAAAKAQVPVLLEAMGAQHERSAGLWHAEWHALPLLFGLTSGALREARSLAEGLVVDTERMRANLDATKGLLFADAAAAKLGGAMGREAAHKLVEDAAGKVRAGGDSLLSVLERDPAVRAAKLPIAEAFDLAPAVTAASVWVERAIDHAADARRKLSAASSAI